MQQHRIERAGGGSVGGERRLEEGGLERLLLMQVV